MSSRKNKKKKLTGLAKFLIFIILMGIIVAIYFAINKDKKLKDEPEEEEKKVQIIDLDSNQRAFGVMIDNVDAARPQHGIQSAYLTYEIIVEGGLTRLFALFKDTNVSQIGPVRSSRHYFLDYALESDAIYVHYGWSPQAQSDISKLKIDNINGLYSNSFTRDYTYHSGEHTAYISSDSVYSTAQKSGYATTSNDFKLLNYSVDEIDLTTYENHECATTIEIDYSGAYSTGYTYDDVNKYYLKQANGKDQIDVLTNSTLHVKNIIILTDIVNTTIDDEKNRQELENVGSGNGFYITDGYAIPITWSKTSRVSKTVYKDENGNVLKVNDGNTYIHLQPVSQQLIIDGTCQEQNTNPE